jgi:3-(3-hydroxy-phenyl)propionate hydroxylase
VKEGSLASKSYDAIICGCGPTGAVAASLLGQRGVSVLVIERRPTIAGFPRAVHFDGEVMRIFQSLGLAEEVGVITHPAAGVCYINANGRKLIEANFTGERVRHAWARGHYFRQPELEAVLRKGLARRGSVQTRLGSEVTGFTQTDTGVTVELRDAADGRTETVFARYLLACDGASSGMRGRLGGDLDRLGPPSTWLVCDTVLDRDVASGQPMYQVCDPARPVTVEPCGGGHARWEFRVLPGDPEDSLEKEGFAQRLMRPYLHLVDPRLEPRNVHVERSKVYTFRSAVAPRWRFGRVFLLGDAAHLMPPFLGQGMCAGIRDAFNLSWKLSGVLRGDYADALLDSYESERRPHVTAVIRDADAIARAIQASNPISAWARDLYLRTRSRLPFLPRPMAREASWSLGPGLFDDDGADTPPADRHNLFDQALVDTGQGGAVRLDDLLGQDFAVLLFGVDPKAVLADGQAAYWRALGTRFLRILPAGALPEHPGEVADHSGILEAWRGRLGGVDVAVVRPDRQVFGRYRGSTETLSAKLTAARQRLVAGLGAAGYDLA